MRVPLVVNEARWLGVRAARPAYKASAQQQYARAIYTEILNLHIQTINLFCIFETRQQNHVPGIGWYCEIKKAKGATSNNTLRCRPYIHLYIHTHTYIYLVRSNGIYIYIYSYIVNIYLCYAFRQNVYLQCFFLFCICIKTTCVCAVR